MLFRSDHQQQVMMAKPAAMYMDVECPPVQNRMMDSVAEHGAIFQKLTEKIEGSGLVDQTLSAGLDAVKQTLDAAIPKAESLPWKSDTGYTKMFCGSCSVAQNCLGRITVGGEHDCCCFNGQHYCGFGHPAGDGCLETDSGCRFRKPTGDCFGGCKILCCKMGIEHPDKPCTVCCGKELC